MRSLPGLALACIMASSVGFGQSSASNDPGPATATCNFNDQQQVAVKYQELTLGNKELKSYLGHEAPFGKVWVPEQTALAMFTNTPLNIGGADLAVGAYTLYLIPNHKEWTLVVSKNTDVKAAYDQSKDIVRAPMEIGQLPAPEKRFSIYFAHSGPKQCTMRIDLADTRAWATIHQK
jgi:hypothetical protein